MSDASALGSFDRTTPPSETSWARRVRRENERTEWLRTHPNECEICHRPPKSRGLAQDHDHKTGKVRGYLCTRCNRVLHAWISPEWLRAAADYLESRS